MLTEASILREDESEDAVEDLTDFVGVGRTYENKHQNLRLA